MLLFIAFILACMFLAVLAISGVILIGILIWACWFKYNQSRKSKLTGVLQ